MSKLMEGVIKIIGMIFLALGGFFVGWLLRGVKARRQLKAQKEDLTKK